MPTYRIEWQHPATGWQFIRSVSGESGPDAFQQFNDEEGLEPGEYRFRAGDDDEWIVVTLTEDGAEIYTG